MNFLLYKYDINMPPYLLEKCSEANYFLPAKRNVLKTLLFKRQKLYCLAFVKLDQAPSRNEFSYDLCALQKSAKKIH